MHRFKWDLRVVGDMYPYEIEIHTSLLASYLEAEKRLAEERSRG